MNNSLNSAQHGVMSHWTTLSRQERTAARAVLCRARVHCAVAARLCCRACSELCHALKVAWLRALHRVARARPLSLHAQEEHAMLCRDPRDLATPNPVATKYSLLRRSATNCYCDKLLYLARAPRVVSCRLLSRQKEPCRDRESHP